MGAIGEETENLTVLPSPSQAFSRAGDKSFRTISHLFAWAIGALPLLSVALAAPAQAKLVTNGGVVLNSASVGTARSAFLGKTSNTVLSGWKTMANWATTPFWSAVVGDGTAISTNMDQVQLGFSAGWPQGKGHGLNTATLPSVDRVDTSGCFLSVDADVRFNNSLEQTNSGLVPGNAYKLSFSQAAGQYAPDPDQAITAYWNVTFGTSMFQSATISVASGVAVTAWQQQATTFTATNTSQVLSFWMQGAPTGGPPFCCFPQRHHLLPPKFLALSYWRVWQPPLALSGSCAAGSSSAEESPLQFPSQPPVSGSGG